MNATLRISSSDVRKELSIQDDRTESDNRVEVTLLKGIAENNLPHTVRCKSTKPPYAERHVRWCGRSVNVKVGGKCLLWITFTSYPISPNYKFLEWHKLFSNTFELFIRSPFDTYPSQTSNNQFFTIWSLRRICVKGWTNKKFKGITK